MVPMVAKSQMTSVSTIMREQQMPGDRFGTLYSSVQLVWPLKSNAVNSSILYVQQTRLEKIMRSHQRLNFQCEAVHAHRTVGLRTWEPISARLTLSRTALDQCTKCFGNHLATKNGLQCSITPGNSYLHPTPTQHVEHKWAHGNSASSFIATVSKKIQLNFASYMANDNDD